MYNTCENGCAYCYANFNPNIATKNHAAHNSESSLICGDIGEDDKVNIRKTQSNIDAQMTLF